MARNMPDFGSDYVATSVPGSGGPWLCPNDRGEEYLELLSYEHERCDKEHADECCCNSVRI